MMKNKVEGHTNIYKDMDTGVITNHNTSDRDRYRLAKEQAMKNINSQTELEELKEEMDEIKSLLRKLVK